MFILDANRLARDRDKLPGEVNGLIEAAGGEIEVSRLWKNAVSRIRSTSSVRVRTDYVLPIRHTKMVELTRSCELQEGVLRQLFVRLPDQLVQPILDHAKGLAVEPEPEADATSCWGTC